MYCLLVDLTNSILFPISTVQHITSLDLLFDWIILSSKYLFECLERLYSQLVSNLKRIGANFKLTDVILLNHTDKCIQSTHSADKNNFLSLLDICRLAVQYQLDYLQIRVYQCTLTIFASHDNLISPYIRLVNSLLLIISFLTNVRQYFVFIKFWFVFVKTC